MKKADANDRGLAGGFTRRSLMQLAAGTALMGSLPAVARAQEWNQRFDAGGLDEANLITSRPILSPQVVASMDPAIAQYQAIVGRGGWPVVPADQTLRLGMQAPAVSIMRQRLIISADLDPLAGNSDVFDTFVEASVRRFQTRHGIPSDGIVGPNTLAAMNVAANIRLGQLIANRQRVADLTARTANRFVMVNLPGAEIEAVENGTIVSRHTAVVGRVDRPSPQLESNIVQINFNPFWTVPASIIRRDLIPLMQREPNYLTDQRIRIYNGNGVEIPPGQVDWYSDEATRYTFRQDPGDFNSLGSCKINFPNPHSVYLHDTPNKVLFGNDYRFDSSGCVRVQNVRQLVTWILAGNQGWNRNQVETMFNSGERLDVSVAAQPKLFFAYVTAWGTESGVVQFRSDIYALDGVGDVAQL
ncbi:MAG: murein L,D-transpeptidase [Bauldia sp.]